MDKIIVYMDDAAYAQQQLAPMMLGASRATWVLVACAPALTRRSSKLLAYSARERWRRQWADRLLGQIEPGLAGRGDTVVTVLAQGPLAQLTEALQARHGPAWVMDARRPKFGQDLAPVAAGQPTAGSERWAVPGALAGLGAAMVLALE